MQKRIVFFVVVILALMLAACGTPAATVAATEVNQVSAATVAVDNSSALDDVASQSLQLAIGVIDLRGSATAIDATQAATLTPLFESLKTLLSNSTIDAAQVQTALDSIKSALTADQVQAISDMGTLTLDSLTMGGPGNGIAMQGTPGAGQAPAMQGTPDQNMQGGGQQGQPPSGTPGAGGAGGNPGGVAGTPAAGDNGGQNGGNSMQTMIDSIKNSTLAPGLNPDLITLVIQNLSMIK